MASKEGQAEEASQATTPKKGGMSALILPLVNTVLVLGVLGLFVYTRLIFKRPVITEKSERARLAKLVSAPTPEPVPGIIDFESVTANLASHAPGPGDPEPVGAKLRYLTFAFSLELRDVSQKEKIEALRPLIMDRILQNVGHKRYHELATIQGRYILKNEIMEIVNQLARSKSDQPKESRDSLVNQLYFTQFVVQ